LLVVSFTMKDVFSSSHGTLPASLCSGVGMIMQAAENRRRRREIKIFTA
jgi:hypothetical protein